MQLAQLIPASLIFFRLPFRNCISCANNCEDLLYIYFQPLLLYRLFHLIYHTINTNIRKDKRNVRYYFGRRPKKKSRGLWELGFLRIRGLCKKTNKQLNKQKTKQMNQNRTKEKKLLIAAQRIPQEMVQFDWITIIWVSLAKSGVAPSSLDTHRNWHRPASFTFLLQELCLLLFV